MHADPTIGLEDVRAEYGDTGDIARLLMGEQLHVGGLAATLDLAERVRIPRGATGIDLCCYEGAGMRALVRLCEMGSMIGVDATPAVVERGRAACRAEGLDDRITFVVCDATRTTLEDASADIVWGEDAWCYVEDKVALVAEAARLVRPGGAVAFTDWVEGGIALDADEARRLMRFMCFPSILRIDEYRDLLRGAGLVVEVAEDTGRMAPCMSLYRQLATNQVCYDLPKAPRFDLARLSTPERDPPHVARLAREGKLAQAAFVARAPRTPL